MCTSTGRQCEYRETPDRRTRASRTMAVCHSEYSKIEISPGKKSSLPAPLVNGGQVDLTPDERWYLDYFRQVTSLQCSSYFYDEFWERLVHQASDIQPAVRHAAIGMGALNWQFAQLRMGTNTTPFDRTFSLQQCNRAIAYLQQNLADDRMGRAKVETAMVTCLVLVCVILFQEDSETAGRHLGAGENLLRQYLLENPSGTSVSQALKQTFAATNLVYATFANKDPDAEDPISPWFIPDEIPNDSGSSEKTHDFLVTLARMVIQNYPRGFRVGSPDPDLDMEPFAVLTKLRGWRAQLKGSLSVHKDRLRQRDLDALTLLELWGEVLLILIMVNTRFQPREIKYDSLLRHFEKVVHLSDVLLISTSLSSAPTFSTNTGVIPPLLFCALKCRDWLVRQQALLLLRRWRRKERNLSICPIVLVSQRIIEIEMEGLTPEDAVPEAARIGSITVEMPPNNPKLRLWYRASRYADEKGHIDQPWRSEWLECEPGQPKSPQRRGKGGLSTSLV